MDLRCQPRALLAFGLVPGLYILKDFLNSHKGKVACRDGLNGCKGTEVVCNKVPGQPRPKFSTVSEDLISLWSGCVCAFWLLFPYHFQTAPDPQVKGLGPQTSGSCEHQGTPLLLAHSLHIGVPTTPTSGSVISSVTRRTREMCL